MNRVVLCVGLLLVSCDRRGDYTLATHHEATNLAAIGSALADVVSKDRGWDVEVLVGEEYNALANIGLVANGDVDFALTGNILRATSFDVSTVLPIYPEIIVVVYRGSLGQPDSLEELLEDRRVGVGPKELAHSRIMLGLIADFGVDAGSFTPVYTPLTGMDVLGGEMDVMITFAGGNPKDLEKQIREGARLFSFDDPGLNGQGSKVDGFVWKNPSFHSLIIPKNSFGKYPDQPILTLAATVILITHEDTSPDVVFNTVSTILENANELSRRSPLLGFLSYDFDATNLNFPLHEGTKQYLNRDQPTFLERYAEIIALLFSIVVVMIGALGSGGRMLRRLKKDRMDVYYQAVQDLERKPLKERKEIRAAIEQLEDLKTRAIDQLQQEKLEGDESFTIFLNLVHHRMARLEKSDEAAAQGVETGE